MYKDIMIDMETLGTTADAVILSIGAVRFDLNSTDIDNDGFYNVVSIDSNHECGQRRISQDTLAWWMGQSEGAKKVFTDPSVTLRTALLDLADWMGEDMGTTRVWSNGASFDIPMLEQAFTSFDIEIPWQFWNASCFRTIKNLPMVKKIPKPANQLAHNAFADALAQAQHLQAMWKILAQFNK